MMGFIGAIGRTWVVLFQMLRLCSYYYTPFVFCCAFLAYLVLLPYYLAIFCYDPMSLYWASSMTHCQLCMSIVL